MLPYLVFTLLYGLTLAVRMDSSEEDTKNRTKRLMSYQSNCAPGCLTCSTVNGCISCASGMYLFLHREGVRQTGVCVHACPMGYFSLELPTQKRCFRCSIAKCESCYSNSYCQKCVLPYTVYNGKCVMRCPPGLFYEAYSQTCILKVDCAVGDWNSWTDCTRNSQICGYKYGIQSRGRETIQIPSPGGLACPPLNEYRQCRMLYRYCSDIENNNSNLYPAVNASTRRRENRQKRRHRCRQRGRVWKGGRCLRSSSGRKNMQNKLHRPDVYRNSFDIASSPQTMQRRYKSNNFDDRSR